MDRPIDWSPENPGPPYRCMLCLEPRDRGEEQCICMKKVSAQIRDKAMKSAWVPEKRKTKRIYKPELPPEEREVESMKLF